jgi:predicted nuclease of predicted toxin-antitoxin system
MKILIDMNLPPRWVQWFANAGWEARHWSKVGSPIASDREIMVWARENGYIVFTHDLDFSALLAATQGEGPSVIQVRTQNVLPEGIGTLVITALKQYQRELEQGAIMTIEPQRARMRILPLTP